MGPPGIDGAQGDIGMPGSIGPDGPTGMNGTNAMLRLNDVDLLSSCVYFNESCVFTTLGGCSVTPFTTVAEVRM